ncbi:MAG: UDP-N-acetylglucosamine 2-epimerase (non-hydrolyzing) [Patescibacteria group bacterium]
MPKKPVIAIVLGTRPEMTKCAPVIFAAQKRGISVPIIHTGQHYTFELDRVFFKELDLPDPEVHVHVGSHRAPRQVGLMLDRLMDAYDQVRPDVVMVQGDTNTVLAGALTALKMDIPVAHLEAGLRSDDWTMPEEPNRILADRISKWLFCPTELQRRRLAAEGIVHDGIHVVGNTAVDASMHFSRISYDKSDIADRLKLHARPYLFLTMHRPGNVDEPERLRALIAALEHAARELGRIIVFPVHPRTKSHMDEIGLRLSTDCFIELGPIGYLDTLRLMLGSDAVLTDSGGVQEEACVLRVPCITLRPNTERPETIHVGANVLFKGTHPSDLVQTISERMKIERVWENPFGDGRTGERVIDILEKDFLK